MVDTLRPMEPPPWQSPCQTSWPRSPPKLNNWMSTAKKSEPQRSQYTKTDFGLPLRSTIASCQFKTTPVTLTYQQRPFVGRCCSCMPNSKSDLFREEYKRPNLHDIFNVDTKHPENGWWTRSFCYFVYLWRRTIPGDFPDITSEVLCTPRVTEVIQRLLGSLNNGSKVTEAKLRKRGRAVLKKMKSKISTRLLKFVAWFLHKFLSGLLTSIIINKNQIQMLKQASKKDLPLIFLPTHRSHLDYILVTFVLVNYEIRPPHVAAGDNLLIPFFGTLMRGLGGFFIRRRLDPKEGQKDRLYRALLHNYMEELLKRGDSMEFFIEGGRSRSGKASYPKGGLLSVIVDALGEGSIPDALLVPTTIAYDKLLDGNFTREQMGQKKATESFWGAMRGIWKVISAQYGYVRVDFGQPFSLQEYVQSASNTMMPASRQPSFDACSSAGSDLSEKQEWSTLRCASDQSLYGCAMVKEDQSQLVQMLAEHVVYTQNTMQPMMSTHVLAFISLTLCRKGAPFKEICQHYNWLKQQLAARNRDVGISGKTETILLHAQQYIGDHLLQRIRMHTKDVKREEDFMLMPSLQLQHIFELAHYAGPVTCVFAAESLLAHAIYAHVKPDAWHGPDDEIIVPKEVVIETATQLCKFLKYEFIMNPPCSTLNSALSDAFDQLVNSDILALKEEDENNLATNQKEWSRRFAASLAMDSEDSDDDDWQVPYMEYELSRRSESIQRLHFLRAVTAPLLETYYVAVCNLNQLIEEDLTEDEYTKRIHQHLKDRVLNGTASYAESAGLDGLRNAMRGLQHMKVLRRYVVSNVSMLQLSPSYKDEISIKKFLLDLGLHLGVPLPQ